jgi:hypothetical protein
MLSRSPASMAALGRDEHRAVALADVDEDDLERPRLDGVVLADEHLARVRRVRCPANPQPAVGLLAKHGQEVAPQHLPESRRPVSLEKIQLAPVRAEPGESVCHDLLLMAQS